MPLTKLKKYLDENKIKYIIISHSSAYTAQEIAARAHIRGRELAKTVLLKIDGKMVMAVLPASYKINFEQLAKELNSSNVRLAYEQEFMDRFPDCEIGAMPPFGNLYGMEVFVAKSLMQDEEISFNACSHTELIKLSLKDFVSLVKPKIIQFSVQSKI
ncbi:MAG: YbaK/EbsC family protein [Ignavibacteriales bacterium]|nr:YbaK/EbsC family protein [Ignavibacteriales bacterium]MBK7379647.1 YbaK/EbsC family protein [Ignavibacteriales bacterium]